MIITQIESEIKSLKDKQEKSLSQIQETTNVILAKINSAQYYDDNVIRDNIIQQYVPVNSIQNLLDLEDVLKNSQGAFTQLVSKFINFIYQSHYLIKKLTRMGL